MKITLKYINGYGPYAYLQKSVRDGDSTSSKHVAYLGRLGGNLVPGATVSYQGEDFTVPDIPDGTDIAEPKRAHRAQQYVIKDKSGKLVYVGHTGDLERRRSDHRRDGTIPPGGELVAETGMLERNEAERRETRRVKNYRRRHGENPPANDVTPQAPGTGRVKPAD